MMHADDAITERTRFRLTAAGERASKATTITLQRRGLCWAATYTGAGAASIADLFGTTTLPTAYTTAAPAGVVVADIERRNPDCNVIVDWRESERAS